MNYEKYTKNRIGVLNTALNTCVEQGNSQIEDIHLLYGLVKDDDGLINNILRKAGINPEGFRKDVHTQIERKPKVGGSTNSRGSPEQSNKIMLDAEDEAKKMGDHYVSVEHIMIALFNTFAKEIKDLFNKYGLNKERFMNILKDVRGTQMVTSDNPEATYEALERFSTDLIKLARKTSWTR